MKIGIDARLIPYEQKEGMAYYAFHLIDNLLKNDSTNKYVFFYSLFLQGNQKFVFDLKGVKNAQNKIFWIPGKILDFFWTQVNFPPIDLLLGKLDLFHTLAPTSTPPYFYLPPQIKGKKIITIHDIFPLQFPEESKKIYNISEYKRALENVVKNADAVISVSKSAQKDLMEFTSIPQHKTYVVYSGVSDDFYKITQADKINSVLNKYRITGKYLLNISNLDYRKNVINLIKAFYLFRKSHNFKLVIAGNKGNVTSEVFATINKLDLSKDIVYLGYVDQEDLVVLLSAAELFVFPSFYEGFGFPNLEAMKCAVPVVSYNVAPIKEIVEDAALLVNPYDPKEMSMAMAAIVTDERLRDDLINKGKKRAQLFSWDKTARDTLAVYKKVIG